MNVGAGLTDRFEAAAELGGSLTPAVVEEPVVDFVLGVTGIVNIERLCSAYTAATRAMMAR